ncbi:MAG: aminoacyl-tRNA hydrolase [Verrucomicrobiota bacterium]|nr:aminoacyl-tRNA hydrolase [Verrucomicrobiota bacterium]
MLNPEVIRLIVGLGNPGREYAGTRHNVGFFLVDRLAGSSGALFRPEKSWRAELAKVGELWLCKPLTYMNLSGGAVRMASYFYKIAPAQMLIVLDDMALPLGKLRLRPSGTAGGHQGLQSIIDHLGTAQFPRLRIGIGAADPGAAVGHVLGRFTLEEQAALEQSVERALAAIDMLRRDGLVAAMNAFN